MTKPNVAIIIGVSQYTNLPPLPACQKDAEIVKSIVQFTGRFQPDHILCLDTDTTSSHVKAELTKFLKTLDGLEINELFFYYSGHGQFDSEFHYLFTDFDDSKPRQTSLKNTDLDEMLKATNSSLTVKVVDACQSGQDYIKSRESIEKALKETESRFNHCYFMFSSDHKQSSFASDEISDFTREFALGIVRHQSEAIRYKDIIDYLSDQFDGSQRQQPFFVTQARHTEVFSDISDSIREGIRKLLPARQLSLSSTLGVAQVVATGVVTSTTTTPPPEIPLPMQLQALVEKQSSEFCTEAEARARYDLVLKTIRDVEPDEPLERLYEVKITGYRGYDIPSPEKLGEWAKESRGAYFVKPTYRTEEYQGWEDRPYSASSIFRAADLFQQGQVRVTKTRQVVDGIENTIDDLPYLSIVIEFIPKLLNVPWWNIWFAVVNSKTHMRLFYAFARLREKNWKVQVPPGKVEWRTLEFPMKDETRVQSAVSEALKPLMGQIVSHLMEMFGLTANAKELPKPG